MTLHALLRAARGRPARRANFARIALISWAIAPVCLAQAPNYDAFSDREGHIATEKHQAGAIALVRDATQLETVYADAVRGAVRARRVWQELEANFAGAGVGVAEKATRPGCLLPGYRELSRSCVPDWSFLDFLQQDRPGGMRLRKIIFSAFAERARERGLENQVILSVINGLLSVGVATAVLRELEVAATANKGLGTNPFHGKTPKEIDKMFRDKGFEPRGPDPVGGKGGYVDPKTGRSYHIDPGGQYKAGTEPPHVDVNRPQTSDLPKRKYPLGDKLNSDE